MKHPMRHLTEYPAGHSYVQAQLIDLANAMGVEANIKDSVAVGDSVILENNIASYLFTCTELDKRPGCSANYFNLVQFKTKIKPAKGAKIIMNCNWQNDFAQGDTGNLTRLDENQEWYARINKRVVHVGVEDNFVVIAEPKK